MRSAYSLRLSGALAGGILLWAAFPPVAWSWCAWIWPLPLCAAARGLRPVRAALLGWLSGAIGFGAILYWLYPMLMFNTGSAVQSLAAWGLLVAYLAVFPAAWVAVLALMDAQGWAMLALAPSLWVALESIRSFLLGGFPWAALGYAQARTPVVVQAASLGGVELISFLLILAAVAAAETLRSRRARYVIAALAVAGAFAAAGAVGQDRPQETTRPLTVAVVQGSIDQYKKWDARYRSEILNTYDVLVRAAAAVHPDVILWPESSVPGFLSDDAGLRAWLAQVVSRSGAWHIVGAPWQQGAGGPSFNASIAVAPDGTVAGWRAKSHLIPFGEYVPARPLLARWFGVLNELGDFTPGRDLAPLAAGPVRAAATICSENFFGWRVRRMVSDGAEIIFNQTNDAWFFRTPAARQHFDMNILRAVETRRWAIVAANTGISGVIDPRGGVERETRLFEPAVFSARVARQTGRSVYVRFGWMFQPVCVCFSIGACAAAFGRRRRYHG